MDPISRQKLEPLLDPKANREMLVFGPYKMLSSKAPSHPSKGIAGGIKLDPNSDTQSAVLGGLCTECMVLSVNMEPSDKTGKGIGITEGLYTHHFVTVDMGRNQVPNPAKSTCPPKPGAGAMGGHGGMMDGMAGSPSKSSAGHSHGRRQIARRQFGAAGSFLFGSGVSVFVGKGNEVARSVFAAANSTVKSGFYMSGKDKIYMTAEFVNYEPADRDIYVLLDYEYIPSVDGKRPADYMDVGMGAIAVDGCMVTALEPPKDKAISYKSPEWDVTHNGYLVNITPHLHDGAVEINVFLNGNKVCNSQAIYGGDRPIVKGDAAAAPSTQEKWETIQSYTPCSQPVKIKKGDKLTMDSTYDLTKHKLRPDAHAMGMGGGAGEGAEGMALATYQFAISPDQSDNF
ncbi:hypothetical protein FKW77_004102 [Venturia effusa]|uniref:Uncharacterized protein n=1 Tax=Venturia effusa TaxID=50376 RepID=A0A517L926_9PEZI|nr:hypothetical protein FKW77_004102 [Venturia effusa]